MLESSGYTNHRVVDGKAYAVPVADTSAAVAVEVGSASCHMGQVARRNVVRVGGKIAAYAEHTEQAKGVVLAE